MPILHDDEFGKITIRRSARASQVRLRVGPDGTLRASMPLYAPQFLVKRLIASSRQELRELLAQSAPQETYEAGMRIGKSHSLTVSSGTPASIKRSGQHIMLTKPDWLTLDDAEIKRLIRDGMQQALRVEAKSYLPKRLKYIAEQHGFTYNTVRFSHASGRWGSCTTEGTISLNIALMKLPFELIDYVLVHELAHTQEMNHSPAFWRIVESADPQFREHRRALKDESPTI